MSKQDVSKPPVFSGPEYNARPEFSGKLKKIICTGGVRSMTISFDSYDSTMHTVKVRNVKLNAVLQS